MTFEEIHNTEEYRYEAKEAQWWQKVAEE